MHTDDDAGTQTGSPARPSVGYPIVIDKQGQTAYRGSRLTPFGQNRKPVSCASTGRDFLFFPLPLLFLQTMPYPPSQLAVEDCLCPKRHLCCVKLSVSYPLNITSISINWEISFHFCKIPVLFCRIHKILVKVEQGFFNRQMTFGHIRLSTASCEGGRTKLFHSGIYGDGV